MLLHVCVGLRRHGVDGQVGSKGTEEGPKGRRSESCRVERTDAVVRAVVDRAARLVKMSPYCTEPIQVCVVFVLCRHGDGTQALGQA
jgi:hypothetical protein